MTLDAIFRAIGDEETQRVLAMRKREAVNYCDEMARHFSRADTDESRAWTELGQKIAGRSEP